MITVTEICYTCSSVHLFISSSPQVKKGRRAELRCVATGNPKPEIHWSREVIMAMMVTIIKIEIHWSREVILAMMVLMMVVRISMTIVIQVQSQKST